MTRRPKNKKDKDLPSDQAAHEELIRKCAKLEASNAKLQEVMAKLMAELSELKSPPFVYARVVDVNRNIFRNWQVMFKSGVRVRVIKRGPQFLQWGSLVANVANDGKVGVKFDDEETVEFNVLKDEIEISGYPAGTALITLEGKILAAWLSPRIVATSKIATGDMVRLVYSSMQILDVISRDEAKKLSIGRNDI